MAKQSKEKHSKAKQSRAEQSKAKQSRAEQSRAEQSRAKQSRATTAKQSTAEQSKAKQSKAKQSRAEQSRAKQAGRQAGRQLVYWPAVGFRIGDFASIQFGFCAGKILKGIVACKILESSISTPPGHPLAPQRIPPRWKCVCAF